MQTKTKAVIYARFSSDKQREESIEGQLRECKAFAEARGFDVIAEYVDRAMSATTDKRPDFQRMIQDSFAKGFSAVIVWKLDRFARSRADSAKYKMILQKNGVKVVSATENLSDSPESVILESVLEGMAEYYSKDLSVKIKRGITENYIHGKWNGGKLPFGYGFDPEKKVVVNEGEAAVVAEIFRLYAETPMTTNQIKVHLREKGVVNRNGQPFTHGTLSSMLLSRRYIGEYGSGEFLNTTLFPPIVDRERFDKVQAKVKMNTRGSGRFKAKDLYLLSGKIFCGNCGSRMNGESGTARNGEAKHYYKCAAAKKAGCGHGHATIKKEFVEQQVVLAVMQFLDDDLSLRQLASKVYSYEQMANPLLKRLEEQLADLERKSQNIMRAIEKGFDGEDVLARYQEVRESKKRLQASLDEEIGKRAILSYDTILWALRRFKTLDVENEFDKRYLIDAFVESVIVYSKDQIDVNFKFWGKKISIISDQGGSDTSQYAPPNNDKHPSPSAPMGSDFSFSWRDPYSWDSSAFSSLNAGTSFCLCP